MYGRCETDPFDQAIDVCGSCSGEFCDTCLLKVKGRKHPICKECAIIASGVRPGAKPLLRGSRKSADQRRRALRDTPVAPPPFEYFDLSTKPDDTPEGPVDDAGHEPGPPDEVSSGEEPRTEPTPVAELAPESPQGLPVDDRDRRHGEGGVRRSERRSAVEQLEALTAGGPVERPPEVAPTGGPARAGRTDPSALPIEQAIPDLSVNPFASSPMPMPSGSPSSPSSPMPSGPPSPPSSPPLPQRRSTIDRADTSEPTPRPAANSQPGAGPEPESAPEGVAAHDDRPATPLPRRRSTLRQGAS